jgi:hypothetical protein
MDRSTRRNTERKLRKLMRSAGDNCSICGIKLPHNSKTFGGVTVRGEAALTGECCSSNLSEVILQGLYVSQGYEFLPAEPAEDNSPTLPPEMIGEKINSFQQYIAQTDAIASDIARRGGVPPGNTRLHREASAWKADDAEWFQKNPKRSHRLRPMLPGEAKTFPSELMPTPPPHHEYQCVVRQVDIGQRIRTLFCRDVTASIPDIEEIIHAIFDTVYKQQTGGSRAVTFREIGELAERYAKSDKISN